MSVFGRIVPSLVGVALFFGAATAWAQSSPPAADTPTDLNEGKTPAQLFAGDCAVCHNRPQGLAKDKNVRSLTGFLRQHYTSSIQTADALAGFLISAGPGAAPATPARGPAFEIPSAANPRRASAPAGEPATPRPPRRVPDAAAKPDAKPDLPAAPRRPASAEASKPAAAENKPAQPAAESKPEAKPAPKPTLEEIFD